jgi:hypothetical protein
MSSVLVPILVAAFIGYQADDLKMKKYDMTNQEGEVLKIQFSKKWKLLVSFKLLA